MSRRAVSVAFISSFLVTCSSGPPADPGGASEPDAGGGVLDGPVGADASPEGSGELTLVAVPGSSLCRRSADGRYLIVTVRNDAIATVGPTVVEVATRDSDLALRETTPALGFRESVDLWFDRALLLGFVPGWAFDVVIDPEGAAHTESGHCNGVRSSASAGVAALHEWYDEGSGLYNGGEWWRGANMLEATIDYSRLTGDPSYVASIANTFEKQSAGGFLNDYYDDEGWWALAWIKAYDLTADDRYLSMARAIFTDMTGGWDDVCGGGLYWRKQRDGKNAIPNELFLAVAARLHLRTPGDAGPGSYLDWALREWSWFEGTGLIGDDNQIVDGLSGDCQPEWIPFTYNQGVILGGLVDLWRATGDESLLDTADDIALAALELMTDEDGVFIEPACDPTLTCEGDGVQFKGIFVRNLACLYEVRPHAAFKEFLLRQRDALWTRNRNAANQFGSRWSGPFDKAGPGRQSSALDALNGAIVAGNPNVALGRTAEGSPPCTSSESAARAVDGSARWGSKWCSGGMSGQELQIDLGAARTVVGFRVRHAGAGGESSDWNTADFEIELSVDGSAWNRVVEVTDNTQDVTTHPVVGVDARFVRLHVTRAQHTAELAAARIYELEVFGLGM